MFGFESRDAFLEDKRLQNVLKPANNAIHSSLGSFNGHAEFAIKVHGGTCYEANWARVAMLASAYLAILGFPYGQGERDQRALDKVSQFIPMIREIF